MSRTLTERQYKSLISKSKVGWACYYRAEAMNHQLHLDYMKIIKSLENEIKSEDRHSVPDFVVNEIQGLLTELKKQVECPICYEELNAEEIKFSSCGHKYCESCLSKINECAICRKKIYHKNNDNSY